MPKNRSKKNSGTVILYRSADPIVLHKGFLTMDMAKWLRLWHIKQVQVRNRLRNTHIHRMLGKRIFHNHIWVIDKRSMAGGLSLGLFIAFTPTIPFQMLLCAIGAVLLRVNLPIGLAACWITNPLTAFPIYLVAHQLGRHLVERSAIVEFTLGFFGFESRTGRFLEQSLYLWTGCLVFSIVSAFLGNILVRSAWSLGHWLKSKTSHKDTSTTS